jgi:hypothetical protein
VVLHFLNHKLRRDTFWLSTCCYAAAYGLLGYTYSQKWVLVHVMSNCCCLCSSGVVSANCVSNQNTKYTEQCVLAVVSLLSISSTNQYSRIDQIVIDMHSKLRYTVYIELTDGCQLCKLAVNVLCCWFVLCQSLPVHDAHATVRCTRVAHLIA